MRVVYGGKQLEDEACMADYDVQACSTLQLLGRLRGGVIEPSMKILAASYKCDKMICRKYQRIWLECISDVLIGAMLVFLPVLPTAVRRSAATPTNFAPRRR